VAIDQALANVRRQVPLARKRTAVLVCPPTARWRLRADRLAPDWLLGSMRWQSDFVRTMVTERFSTIDEYWRTIGAPIAHELDRFATLGCLVQRDVAFHSFATVCQADRYDLIMLVAHHVESIDEAEFADGTRRLDEVMRVIDAQPHTAVAFFLCASEEWRDSVVTSSGHRHVAAGAPWRFPWRRAITFLSHWLQQIDGQRTADEALAAAIGTFMNRPRTELNDD
jgi:hypothetical protein